MIIIYDMSDNELPVAVMDNRKQAAEWLGVHINSITNAMCRSMLIHKRYTTKFYSNQELDRKEV